MECLPSRQVLKVGQPFNCCFLEWSRGVSTQGVKSFLLLKTSKPTNYFLPLLITERVSGEAEPLVT